MEQGVSRTSPFKKDRKFFSKKESHLYQSFIDVVKIGGSLVVIIEVWDFELQGGERKQLKVKVLDFAKYCPSNVSEIRNE